MTLLLLLLGRLRRLSTYLYSINRCQTTYTRVFKVVTPQIDRKTPIFMLKHFVPSDYVRTETADVFRFFSTSKITLQMDLRFILTMDAYIISPISPHQC